MNKPFAWAVRTYQLKERAYVSKNRWVNTRFWGDNYVMELEPKEKLFFLYCILNDHTSLCGAYEISLRTVCIESGLNDDEIAEILEKFERDGKIMYRNGYMIVRNYRKYQVSNASILSGIDREKKELPDYVLDRLGAEWVQTGDSNPIPKPILIPKLKLKPKPNGNGGVAETAPAETKKNETFANWEKTIGPITATVETQRKSCVALENKYGVENCAKAIRIVAMAHSDKFARKEAKCFTPTSLLNNWDKVLIYAKSKFAQEGQKGVPSV